MSGNSLPGFWAIYTSLHPLGDSKKISPNSWAQEEALDQLLTDYQPANLPSDTKVLRKRFNSLCINRAAKHRHRVELEKAYRKTLAIVTGPESDPAHLADMRERVGLAEAVLSPEEARIFRLVAEGHTIGRVATELGVPGSTLRSRLHRLRFVLASRIADLRTRNSKI